MNILKKVSVAVGLIGALATLPQSAKAQAGAGFDYFGVPRSYACFPDIYKTAASPGTAYSNTFDRIGMAGIASMRLHGITNLTGQSVTASVYSSPDQTNWTAVSYALGTNISQYTSNYVYGLSGYTTNTSVTPPITNGTGITITNFATLPAVPTAPNIATAGFAGPYGLAIPFTNTGTITLSGSNETVIGFQVSDCGRYISTQFTVVGTNVAFGADVMARKEGN